MPTTLPPRRPFPLAPTVALTLLTLLALACQPKPAAEAAKADAPPAPAPAAAPPPAQVVDSELPREEMLRRFTRDLPEVTALAGGERSAEALARRYLAAVAARDTAALRQLTVSRAEFAWLIYPTAKQGLPPYALTPQMLWFLTEGQSNKGLGRVLQRYGGQPLTFVRQVCDPTANEEGRNRIHGPCTITFRRGGQAEELRFYSLLVERDGRWKILNHGNKL